MAKAMKGTGVIKKLRKTISWNWLISIYQSILRLYFDYGDVLYD